MHDVKLHDDDARLAALRRLDVLDSAVEEPFEKIVTLVRTVLGVPMATVTLVDRDRQWFKARRGIDVAETPRSISLCTHTIQQREALIIEDTHGDPRFADNPLVTGAPHIRAYAGIPLRTPDGYNVGSLCAMDTKARAFTPADIAILTNCAHIVSDELELRMVAQVDFLTGALTRRAFVEQAEREIARAARYHRPSTIVMLDVDHFKSVNDTYGHAAGDQVLHQLAELATLTLRPSDVFGRLGGEEFALLLPETGTTRSSPPSDCGWRSPQTSSVLPMGRICGSPPASASPRWRRIRPWPHGSSAPIRCSTRQRPAAVTRPGWRPEPAIGRSERLHEYQHNDDRRRQCRHLVQHPQRPPLEPHHAPGELPRIADRPAMITR